VIENYLFPPEFNMVLFKRKTLFLFFGLFFSISLYSQTTNISGIVNTYHQVVEIVPAKACIRVADITGLNVNSRVMLIQMKGATINTANTAAFGDTTSLNEAGNYEIGTVCYIIGDSVFLFHTLLNNYNTSTGKVQLVQFAEYYSANVIDTVKAAAWKNSTGTGGVIAIFCDQDLTLNKPIFADSSGYIGGTYLVSTGACSNPGATGYAYNGSSSSPQDGAYKGEGAADVVTTQTGGRGAAANGGGGGNNHNNSGGGGANINPGGIGGGNSSSTGCTNTLRGGAGKAMSSWNGQKIFMGGGGGAGHSNNGLSSVHGGDGGGIIFIWANNLIGNGELISTNGGSGGNSVSDGAGGGGGGGTIIMHITNYTGPVTVSSNGGGGGNSEDGGNIRRCFGGGGGGSGGVIYFTGATPGITNTVAAGLAGIETNRDALCAAEQAALPGSNGQVVPNYTISRSTDPAGYCRLLLPVKLIKFNASVINKNVLLEWEIDNPETVKQFIVEKSIIANQWMELKVIPGHDQHRSYTMVDKTPLPGKTFYRIKFIEKNNTPSYSPIRQIIAGSNNEFTVYPNPATNRIMIAGNNNLPAIVKLLDVSGKIIYQSKAVSFPAIINLPYFSPGIYLLRINHSVQKLVIH